MADLPTAHNQHGVIPSHKMIHWMDRGIVPKSSGPRILDGGGLESEDKGLTSAKKRHVRLVGLVACLPWNRTVGPKHLLEKQRK